MKEKHKILLFTLVIVVLLISITSTSATSLNQTTTNTTITTQPNQTTTIETTHKPVKNITKKNIKNLNNKNETIKTVKNTTKKHNIKSDQETITINPRNKDRFNDYEFEDNTHIIIEGTVKDLHITIDTKNMTITGKNNRSQLYNSMIEETEDGNVHISNLTFNTTTESQYDVTMNLYGYNNIIDHVNFYTEHDKYPQEHYREINIESNNNSIHDCYFDIIYPGVNIDWSTVYGGVRKANVIIAYGDHNKIYNNTIKLKEGVLLDKDYGTIEAIDIFGSNNLVTENNIDVRGTRYLYGIMVYYDNNTITNNVINVISVRYANGISIDGIASNCTVENNTIHVECQNNTINSKTDDSAYGIIIIESDYKGFQYNIENSRVANNILKGNTITGSASQMYGIENFGGTGTRVESNHIDISGGRVQGIAYAGAENVIIGNDVKVAAKYSDLLENSPDYFRPWTAGIYSYSGHKNFIFNNTVSAENGSALRIDREYNTTATGNSLSSVNSPTIHITRNSAGNVVYGNTLLSNSDEDSISTISGNMVYNNFGRRISPETDPTNPNNPFNQNQTNTNQTQNPVTNNTNTNQTQNPTTNNTNTNQPTNTNQTQNPTTNNTNTNQPTNTNQTQNPVTNNTNTNQPTNTNQTQNPTANNTNTNQPTNTNQTQNPVTNNTNTNQPTNTNQTQNPVTNNTNTNQPTNTNQTQNPVTNNTNTNQPTNTNTTQPTQPTNTNQSTNHNTTTQQNQNNTQITNQTIQNTTIPQKQQTNTNSSQIVNNTRQRINSNEITKTNSSTKNNQKQTSSTGQSPEHGEDSSSSDSESSDSSDSSDSSTSDASTSESSQQSESSVSSAVGSSGAAQATAVVSEITPKESKIENPFNPYVIVGILLILTVAFAYGFTKQSRN